MIAAEMRRARRCSLVCTSSCPPHRLFESAVAVVRRWVKTAPRMSKKQDKMDNGIVAVKSKVGIQVAPSIVNNDIEDVGTIAHYLNCFAV